VSTNKVDRLRIFDHANDLAERQPHPNLERTMTNHHAEIAQLAKVLRAVSGWLDKAEAHAKAKNFDANTLLTARLAPDMFPLVRQIQSACDGVKFYAARLAGQQAPKHPDTEQTIEALRTRIKAVLDYVGSFSPDAYANGDSVVVPLPFMPGKGMLGSDYAREMVLPNTYFHLATAYAILRHNGVELGKYDFLASLTLCDI
jgi:hypothetical protein